MLNKRIVGVVVGLGALVGGANLAYADEAYIPLI